MADPTEFNDDLPNPFSREEEDSEYETIRCPECGSIRWTLFTPDDQSICYANCIECRNVYFISDSIEELERRIGPQDDINGS